MLLPSIEYYSRLLYLSVAMFFALLLVATLILVLTCLSPRLRTLFKPPSTGGKRCWYSAWCWCSC